MRQILFILILSLVLGDLIAQPFALSLNNVDGSPYTCNSLEDLGTYKRLRVMATQNSSDGRWELPQICSFPGNVWRPYTDAEATAIPFNVAIPPTPSTYGALWNSNNGGVPGRLSPVTNGNYYTFNVQNITCNSGICNSPFIGVLETPYLPVTFPAVSQMPFSDAVGDNVPVTITVTSSSAPIENVFLRYTINDYVNTTIVPVIFSGTTGIATIPGFPLGTVVKYYIYSTNKSQSLIESEVASYGEIVHDMSTLEWNINLGSNYTYTVLDITPITIQYLKGSKKAGFNELSWKLECSNVDAVALALERSSDGINYSSIYAVNADPSRCLQPFYFKDGNFKDGINYYRLKIHNTEGEAKHSNVVALVNNMNNFEVINSGYSISNKNIYTIEISATTSMNILIELVDLSGKRLERINTRLNIGTNKINIPTVSMASGIYCLAVRSNYGDLKTLKILKQ